MKKKPVKKALVKPASKPKKPVKKNTQAKPVHKKPVKPAKPVSKKHGKSAGKSSKRKISFRNLKYKLNQKIVYPLHGVGQVTSIEERTFQDKKILYYVIYLDVPDMTVWMPVNEADERGIRAIVSKNEAQKALNVIAKECPPISADWKMRYQMNLDLLKKGSVIDIAKVVRSLYNRSKIKELPILERKLFDNALKLLIDEVSYSMEKEKDQVEALIYKRMDEE
ncbi:MAG: CarD family transcriptional regulator [Spirochaetaceae bacterium]|nr:MAG: CarD family transcriptional regulator [Spirochaetaceae bacterium]